MAERKADLPFTLRGYRTVAERRRARLSVVPKEPPAPPRRDELSESLAAAEEIAEILAAQNGDDVEYYRHQATQIVGFMLNSGWSIVRRDRA